MARFSAKADTKRFFRMEGTDHCNCSLENAFTLPTDWGWGTAAKCGLVCRHLFGYFHTAGNCFNCVTVLFCWPWFPWIVDSRLCWPPFKYMYQLKNNSQNVFYACSSNFPVSQHILWCKFSIFEKANYHTLAAWCLVLPGCVGVQPLAIRACLIPQILPGVLHQGQPAESYLPPMPAAHAGFWALICLPGTEPTIGGLGRVYHDHIFIIHIAPHRLDIERELQSAMCKYLFLKSVMKSTDDDSRLQGQFAAQS